MVSQTRQPHPFATRGLNTSSFPYHHHALPASLLIPYGPLGTPSWPGGCYLLRWLFPLLLFPLQQKVLFIEGEYVTEAAVPGMEIKSLLVA